MRTNQHIEDGYFENTKAIEAVNSDTFMPSYLLDDEGNRAFKLTYVQTDGWRGYYNATATKKHKWEKVDSDWVTGDYDDAIAQVHGETPTYDKLDLLAYKLKRDGYKMAVVYSPTSNVFSTSYDIFKKKVEA